MINRRAPVPVALPKMTAQRNRSNLIKIGKNNMLLFFHQSLSLKKCLNLKTGALKKRWQCVLFGEGLEQGQL
jgi:hypothetical protein